MTHNHQHQSAEELHEHVPPDWYFASIKRNILQRFWHKTRFAQVASLTEQVDGKVLDVGSADGVFTSVILKRTRAKKIVGLEVLKESVAWANNHWKHQRRMSFMVGDAHKLPFKSNDFSAVFALEVLEHVFNPKGVLVEVKRVLKKGGYAIFLVPTDNQLFKIIWFFWTKLGPGRIWDHTHVQSYTDGGLAQMCSAIGFKVVQNKFFLLGMLNAVKVKKT